MVCDHIEENDIVISGIGIRLPDSTNLEELADIIYKGENPVHHDDRFVPGGYYGEYPEYNGRTKDPWNFDCTFFGVSKVVARSMDPMVRKILECTFEAVLDAGLNPGDLKDTYSSFYSGTTFSDYDLEWDTHFRGGYGIMGRNRCMNANRVSYWLNCHGTSVSTDCNWANGLVNLELAWNAIKNGHCDAAVVNGASMSIHNELILQIRDLGVLNMDGKTKSLDDAADGYTRSDGVVVLVLQRAKKAKRCYASIRHVFAQCTAMDGSIYSKSTENQWEAFLTTFYDKANINLNDIIYYEANAAGLREEDANELNAVAKVLCRNRDTPLHIGTVKSNIGHTEAASGLTGVVKAVLSFERDEICANLHYKSPNKLISGLADGRLKVVTENMRIPPNKYIAISAYGYGGVYGHILLKGSPYKRVKEYDRIPRLVLISGQIKETIDIVLDKLESIPYNEDYCALLHEIFTKKVDKYLARGYTILPKRENQILRETEPYVEEKRPVWFIFSGMGSQWNGMGKALLQLPIFRESIEKSHAILTKKGLNLLEIITTDDPKIFDNILHAFVGIAATQIALVDILHALEIVPDGIIGHSVGELGCAYADGCLTAEQMILCAYYRGLASIETDLIRGYMAAVGKGYQQIKDELPPEVDVACHNSADSCTLSGPAEIVQQYVEKLKQEKVFAKTVNVADIAYHSRYIRPVAPKLFNYLKEVIPDPKPRSSKWVSTSNSREEWDTELAKYCSAEYHTKNLTNAVLFEEGCADIPENAICIEIAPHGLLQAILKRSLPAEVVNIPLTRRVAEDQLLFFLQAIGKFFLAGMYPNVSKLYPPVEFPVSRGTPSVPQIVHWNFVHDFPHNFRINKKTQHSIRNELLKTNIDGVGCVIDGRSIYPASVYLTLSWDICLKYNNKVMEKTPIMLRAFRLDKPLHFTTIDENEVTLLVNSGTSYLEISIDDTVIIGQGYVSKELEQFSDFDITQEKAIHTLNKDDIYVDFKNRGYDFTGPFQVLDKVEISENCWKGFVKKSYNWTQKLESLIQLAMLEKGEATRALLYPVSFERIIVDPNEHADNLEDDNEYFEVNYIIAQNAIVCPGIEINGIKFRELARPKSTLSFETQEFYKYDYDLDVSHFVEHCLKVLNVNKAATVKENPLKVARVVGLETSDLGINIDAEQLDFNVDVEVEKFSKEFSLNHKVDLLIADFNSLEEINSLAQYSDSLIVKSNGKLVSTLEGFEVVSRCRRENLKEEILFLRKTLNLEEVEFLTISDDELVLINILNNRNSSKNTVCLISYEEPHGGIESYIATVEKSTTVDLRWLFVLDKNAPAFNATVPFYYEQILKNLRVNVYANGTWGILKTKTFSKAAEEQTLTVFSNALNVRAEVKIDYVGLNLESAKSTTEIVTDFSGRLATGTPIMGMVSLNGSATMQHDPHLMWQIPLSWSSEEACTVPQPFLFAYYCLRLIGAVLPYEYVLVTDGISANSRAAIAVALTLAQDVYVTVANLEEKAILLKTFPQLKAKHVFLQSKDFNLALQMEVGKKNMPHVIINSLEGDCFAAALQCLNMFGRFFNFGREDIENNRKIGTSPFLNYNTLYQISSRKIINLTAQEKDEIQGMVLEGIRKGVVRPLPFIKLTSEKIEDYDSWHKGERKSNRLVIDVNIVNKDATKLVADTFHSYIIFGDETDVWLDLTESLIQQGVKNLVIVKAVRTQSERTKRRIEFLNKRVQLNIKIFEEGTKNSFEVLETAEQLGPVAAAFFICLSQDPFVVSRAEEFDRLWRSRNGHFLVFSAGQKKLTTLCENRLASGYRATNLLWSADQKLIGSHFDSITQLSGQKAVINVTNSARNQNIARNAGRILLDILPKQLKDLNELGENLGQEAELIEMTTMSTKFIEAKNLSPIIVIPGLQYDPIRIVQPMAKRLWYPVFCAKIPHIGEQSVECIAAGILEQIRRLKRKARNFNVVGISWGCAVALELTKQLESIGHKVALITIDNPLYAIQQGRIPQKTIDSVLLSLITSKSNQQFTNFTQMNWESSLDSALSVLNLDSLVEGNIRKAATFVKNHMHSLLKYNPEDLRLLGPLTVLRSSQIQEEVYYTKLCHHVVIRDYPMGHDELINSQELISIIHQATLCEDMTAKNAHFTTWIILEKFIEEDKNCIDGGLLLNLRYLQPVNTSQEETLAIQL